MTAHHSSPELSDFIVVLFSIYRFVYLFIIFSRAGVCCGSNALLCKLLVKLPEMPGKVTDLISLTPETEERSLANKFMERLITLSTGLLVVN